jgi:hypothetical protein
MTDTQASGTGTALPSPIIPLSPLAPVAFGAAAGLMAAFTAFGWPFAVVLSFVIGEASGAAARGERASAAARILRILAVTGGVAAMLWAGALIGGLIAFAVLIAGLAAERRAEHASRDDRQLGRVIFAVVVTLVWGAVSASHLVTVSFR